VAIPKPKQQRARGNEINTAMTRNRLRAWEVLCSESLTKSTKRKGDVRGVVEVVLGEHLPKPTRPEEVAPAGAASLKSRRAPCISPGPNVLGYVHGVGISKLFSREIDVLVLCKKKILKVHPGNVKMEF
jgi:hypothetical protein